MNADIGAEDLASSKAGSEPDQDALFIRLKEWTIKARDHLDSWRKDAVEDFGFVSGDQWEEADKQTLRDQLRPIITFNRVGPIIDSVSGMEVGNRQEIHYYPREVQDSGKGELLSNAAKFFREQSDAEDEESDAFFDVVVTGLAWLETRPDYENDPEGELLTERIDPLACFYDPAAKKRNLTDRRYCGYIKEVSLEDAREMFPDADDDELHAAWAAMLPDTKTSNQAAGPDAYNPTGDRNIDPSRDKVTIVYIEWWDREAIYTIVAPQTGEQVDVPAAQWEEAQGRMAALGIQFKATRRIRRKYQRAFLGSRILESGQGRCPYDFSLNPITGKRDRNDNTWYGLVRGMKDPQRWANKFFSQTLHIMNSNSKGGLMAERGAFDNPRKAEEEWADPAAITWLKNGALAGGMVKEKPPAQYPAGLDRLLQFSIASIRDSTGVNLELLGMADREQAGVLEYQRRQAGMTILATMFDGLRHYRKVAGRVLLHMIQTVIPPGRLIRIDEQNGPRYAPLILDETQTRYDVIVDDAPTSPNQKEVVWATITQMIPFLAKQPIPAEIWAKLLRYSPLPESVAVEIGEKLMQAAQQPPAPDPRVVAMREELKIKQAEAQLSMQQSQAQHEQQMAMETQKSQQEMAIRQAEAAQAARIEQMKAVGQVMMAETQAAHQQRMAEHKATTEAENKRQATSAKISSDTTVLNGIGKALQPIAEALVQSAQANVQASQAQAMAIERLAAQLAKPKKVLRDERGRAVAVQ